jgi:hypothetical protein
LLVSVRGEPEYVRDSKAELVARVPYDPKRKRVPR